jgi:cellulose synthase/poly-beta-1,6-N-acetylglucosamine synthase-like glycosyltransferase
VILFALASYLLCLFYILLMLYFTLGWVKLPEFVMLDDMPYTMRVSIIIPARNEEKNIRNVLQCIRDQSYPRHFIEVLVIDDNSTDATAPLAEASGAIVIRNQVSGNTLAYKKQAIATGIQRATGELILCTDADCTMGPRWIESIVAYQYETGAQFISSPVMLWPLKNFFEEFQALEFSGLVGIGGASLQMGFPNMCNGANIAYMKDAFNAVDGFAGNDTIPSGDDEFLMHKMHQRFPGKVVFLKSFEAIVRTLPSSTPGEFIRQRMRWVSKSTKYADKRITTVLALSYLFNLALLIAGIGSFYNADFLILFLFLLSAKVITEGVLLYSICQFFGTYRLPLWLIPEQLFHIVYVVIIGILGNTFKYNWKGRKV